MAPYRCVLVAIDVTVESRQVVGCAAALVGALDAELHLLHAIEPASLAYGGVMLADLHSGEMLEVQKRAKARVADLGAEFGIPAERQHVTTGRSTSEIHRMAKAKSADLVVVGSHGRHGLGLLLGSTASGVLHGAECDVLAVRVRADAARSTGQGPDPLASVSGT